jgi:hypothetical protein
MFASVNRWGISIKVGGESINANYMVNSPEDVLQFLKAMIL